ncbi:hypothetical protein JCM3766R1_000767 [Sporobolomyces carnicolor]
MLRSSTRRLVFYSASSSTCAVSPLLALPRAIEPLHPWHNRVQPARYFSSSRCVGGQVEDFKLADIGEGITECEIVKWLVKPGDVINEFDPVAEVQSDKASVEITSPFSGTIKSIAGDVGDMLKVGETLCRVEVESTRGQEEQDAQANETRPLRAEPDAPERQSAGPVRETKHFKLADIGEGITECEVVKWLVSPGDTIEEFDPIVEVTSDKASVEITSPFSGTIKSLAGEVGDMLKVGSTLCEIETVSEAGVVADADPSETVRSSSGEAVADDRVPHPVRPDRRLGSAAVLATPATRRFARELSVDLAHVTPTGRDGRVTKGDVLEHSKKEQKDERGERARPFVPFERAPIQSAPPESSRKNQVTSATSKGQAGDTLSLSPTRRAMFKAMTASLEIPHFAYSETIDVTELERVRVSLNSNVPLANRKTLSPRDVVALERIRQWRPDAAEFNENEGGTTMSEKFDRITLLPLLVKSLSVALHEHALFTCMLQKPSEPGAAPSLVRRAHHDISVAVSSPRPSGGLYTPVIASVDTQSVFSIASRLALVQSCLEPEPNEGTTTTLPQFPREFQGAGTITLSNIGAIGGRTTHPVIPPTGQLAIGALGRVRVEPRFATKAEEERARQFARGEGRGGSLSSKQEWNLEPRLVMDVTFSADHRVVEGVELARLVETWKNVIEDPTRLMVA